MEMDKKIKVGAFLIGMYSSLTAFAIGSTAESAALDVQNTVGSHPLLPMTASSLFAPMGYGPNWGVVYGSLIGVNEWPGASKADGAAVVGAGLGDSDKYVGGSVNVLVDSLGFYGDRFGQNTAVSGSVYRWLTPSTSISVGAGNIFGSGVFQHAARSFYGSVTQLVALTPNSSFKTPVALTFGLGSGAFVSPAEMLINQSDSQASAYGAISVSPIQQLSLIADFTEQVLSLGVSVTPKKTWPVVLTAYATNIAGDHQIGNTVTYGLRLGLAYAFA